MTQKNNSAIYAIRHTTSGKVYVGSAVRVLTRWSQHRSLLNNGKHHSRHLQSAWNKHGIDAFEFIILELVSDVAMLIDRENAHIARLCSADPSRGYNLRKDAGSQLGMRHSDSAKKKMSDAHKGKTKTPEHQAAINASLTGRTLSDEHRVKIATNQTGRIASEETRKKMRESQAAKVLSPESHKRMAEANVGRKFTEEHRQRIAAANRRRVLSTETKAKISAARKRNEEMKKTLHDPLMGYELRSKLSAAANTDSEGGEA